MREELARGERVQGGEDCEKEYYVAQVHQEVLQQTISHNPKRELLVSVA